MKNYALQFLMNDGRVVTSEDYASDRLSYVRRYFKFCQPRHFNDVVETRIVNNFKGRILARAV